MSYYGSPELDRSGSWLFTPLVKIVGLAFFATLDLAYGHISSAIHDSGDAKTYIEQKGYTDVEYVGTNHLIVGLSGCDMTDGAEHVYRATALNGQKNVEVNVCAGALKGMTDRGE